MSPEEKLMMSMLKEESGVDALDRTMERVGVDIEKVMERVQTMTNGGGIRTPGGATGEEREEDFIPEEAGFEEPDLAEPIPSSLLQDEDDDDRAEPPVSLYDKAWGMANNFVLIDASSKPLSLSLSSPLTKSFLLLNRRYTYNKNHAMNTPQASSSGPTTPCRSSRLPTASPLTPCWGFATC